MAYETLAAERFSQCLTTICDLRKLTYVQLAIRSGVKRESLTWPEMLTMDETALTLAIEERCWGRLWQGPHLAHLSQTS